MATSSALDKRSDSSARARASSSMSASTTFMPSVAKRPASPKPIPLAARVATATLPLSCCTDSPSHLTDMNEPIAGWRTFFGSALLGGQFGCGDLASQG